jgi:cell division protein FtsB
MAGVQHNTDSRRGGLSGAVFGLVLIALMAYLTFAAIQGEHGLFRLFQIEAQEKKLVAELDALRAEREALATRTRQLSTHSLDLEMLDERARLVLGLARPDEIIVR